MRPTRSFALMIAMLCSSAAATLPAAAQSSSGGTSPPAPLFASDDLLELTLRTDIRTLSRDRDSVRRVYHDATITLPGNDGGTVTVPLTLRTRGHYRRQSLVCGSPPLRMRFRGRGARGTVFEGQRDLKLVVQCRERADYEQFLLKEYFVYRTYELLTDRSFRTRLVRITWEDAGGRSAPRSEFAFIIESEQGLEKRLGGHLMEAKGARDHDLDQEQTRLVDLFQYMIGNTDWSIPGLHNIRLFWYRDTRRPFPVPYDFDWSGTVEARYASPNERLPIKSVRTRLYRGLCRQVDEMAPTIALFQERRAAIEELWRTAEHIDNRSRSRTLDYLDAFYGTIGNAGALRREMSVDCRKP